MLRGRAASPGTAQRWHNPGTTCLWPHRTADPRWSLELCRHRNKGRTSKIEPPQNKYSLKDLFSNNDQLCELSHYITYITLSQFTKKCTFMEHLYCPSPEGQRETEMLLAQNQLMCNLFHSAQSWHWLRRSRKTSLFPFKLTELSNKDWTHFVATDTAGEKGGERRRVTRHYSGLRLWIIILRIDGGPLFWIEGLKINKCHMKQTRAGNVWRDKETDVGYGDVQHASLKGGRNTAHTDTDTDTHTQTQTHTDTHTQTDRDNRLTSQF